MKKENEGEKLFVYFIGREGTVPSTSANRGLLVSMGKEPAMSMDS